MTRLSNISYIEEWLLYNEMPSCRRPETHSIIADDHRKNRRRSSNITVREQKGVVGVRLRSSKR